MQTLNELSRWVGAMGVGLASIVGASIPLAYPASTLAQTASPYEQLQRTRSCVDCNLSNLDLRGLDLSGANLQGANLSNANLAKSNLTQANLSGANLYLANLSGSNLNQASLVSTSLKSANLSGATLNQSALDKTSATYANFSGASFTGASIQNSDFSDTNLAGSRFDNAKISSTQFNFSNLDQANLGTATVSNSSFDTASTQGTTLPSPTLVSEANPTDEAQSQDSPQSSPAESESAADNAANNTIRTPLSTQNFQQPSAETLPPGTVVGRVGSRFYSLPDRAAGDNDTSFYPTFQLNVGVAKDLELSASYQQADSNSPGVQGPFLVSRGGSDPGNDEATIAAKYRFWKNSDQTFQVSALGALSFGNRQATFRGNGPTVRFENDDIVPMLQVPVTAKLGDRTRFTLAPTVSFFNDSNALFLFRPPIANPGSFGTTFGFAGAASHELIPRLSLFGDAFAPLTGNNSVSRASGRPNKEIAFNAGVRFLVNPRLGLDVFATNTQGTLGPMALTTQGDIGIGANLVFMPNLIAGNRKIADSFGRDPFGADSPVTVDGIGFFDGGTIPKNKVAFHLQGGSQGIMGALRYGVLKDLEASVYLNYILGNVDESEQGIGAKVRLLNQDKGAPFTASIQGTLGQTNEPFFNFINNDSTAFLNSGVDKTVPSILNRDGSNGGGRLFIATVSAPLHYKLDDRAALWLTPMLGYVQREGLEAAGLNAGGSLEVIRDVSVIAEVGAEFIGKGNSFSSGRLKDRIPWTVAVRWDPSTLLGRDRESSLANPNVELYLTNRVGSSVWQQMRVREGGDPAVGVGLFIPF